MITLEAYPSLVTKYREIDENFQDAIKRRVARLVPGSSVIRPFKPGTVRDISCALMAINVDVLPTLKSQTKFHRWFSLQVKKLAPVIKVRIKPGKYRANNWGHAAKILCLYLRQLVLESPHFTRLQAKRICAWLYVPIDSIVRANLPQEIQKQISRTIKGLTAEEFFFVQDALQLAAMRAGVPRIWFDYVWSGDRS